MAAGVVAAEVVAGAEAVDAAGAAELLHRRLGLNEQMARHGR